MKAVAGQIDLAMRRYLASKENAARRRGGAACHLPPGIAEALYRRQRGRYAVSGVAFSFEPFARCTVKYPYGPSLDRIDSARPYSPSNIRLVCNGVNFALGEWGEEPFLKFAHGAVRLARRQRANPRA